MNMTQREARLIVMRHTWAAMQEYDKEHGGLRKDMTSMQVGTYAENRMGYVNDVLVREISREVRLLAV